MQERKILVVEDDPILRSFFNDVLKRKGCDCTTSENGLGALEEIKKKPFQLVITDMKMKGMDGLELLGRIKETVPQIDVVIITAYGSIPTAVQAMKQGAFDYITKPVDLEELDMVIDRVFERRKLIDENAFLKEELNRTVVSGSLIGKSSKTQRIRELVEMVGPLDSTVLIHGETGTGKEIVANAIHQLSDRRDKPFIKVNCAALPDTLLESELFGYEKGAFTGAIQRSKGRFELADGGTLLLDEVGELGIQVQAKLLRALQYQQFERVGSGKSLKVDVRVIATTNRTLKEEVKKGSFRKDLFFRLNVVSIALNPLRQRREDIPYFVDHFLKSFNTKYHKGKILSDEAMELLVQYNWPGNVRELENCLETAVILNRDEVLQPDHFHFLEEHRDLLIEEGMVPAGEMTLAEGEKRLILSTFRKKSENKTHTAKALGITIKTLRTKLREYGVLNGKE